MSSMSNKCPSKCEDPGMQTEAEVEKLYLPRPTVNVDLAFLMEAVKNTNRRASPHYVDGGLLLRILFPIQATAI